MRSETKIFFKGLFAGLFILVMLISMLSSIAIPVSTVAMTQSASDLYAKSDPEFASIEQVRQLYEKKHDLRSILEYGRILDATITRTDSIRVILQKEFFKELAKDAGSRYGINWKVLYGLWMRESAINYLAKGDGKKDNNGKIIPGSFRAFGLGQIHLKTAQAHYDPNITNERLLDPIENGYASAKILKDYIDLFEGNNRTLLGISAYQQGPANTKLQYKNKVSNLRNADYVFDVLRNAAEVE